MSETGSYKEYAKKAAEDLEADSGRREMLADSVREIDVTKVLDVGCGAGQEMVPFAERFGAYCIGIDIGAELGTIAAESIRKAGYSEKIHFVRSMGEHLPFADESFDVVLCRVALPYMNNRKAIKEVGRVLRPGGVYLLKTHAPAFYFGMIKRRLFSFDPRQYAYPIFCMAGGIWHQLCGSQPKGPFWKGKEVYQTKKFLQNELLRNKLRIKRTLPDSNVQTPSFYIVKDKNAE